MSECDHVVGYVDVQYEGGHLVYSSEVELEYEASEMRKGMLFEERKLFTYCPDCGVKLRLSDSEHQMVIDSLKCQKCGNQFREMSDINIEGKAFNCAKCGTRHRYCADAETIEGWFETRKALAL